LAISIRATANVRQDTSATVVSATLKAVSGLAPWGGIIVTIYQYLTDGDMVGLLGCNP
jgi:hypothetical protein